MPVFRENNDEAKTSAMTDVKEDDDLSPNGSGRYRMAIGPAKIRLIDYLNNVKSRDYDFSSIVDLLELKKAATNAVSTCTKDLKQVQSTAELLKDYNGKWLKLLSCLSGQALEKEDAIYMKCAGGEKGYVKLMDEALSVSACLEAKLEELKDYQKRVNDQYISSNALSNGVNSQVNFSISPSQLPTMQTALGRPQLSMQSFKNIRFDGNILKYPPFKNMLKICVLDRTDLSDIEKLGLLLGQLEGRALESVAGFDFIPESLTPTVETLDEKYGNKEVNKQTLHAELMNMKRSSSKLQEVRRTFEDIERILRSMNAIKEDVNHWHILKLVETKLPKWVLEEVFREKNRDEAWDMSKMLKCIEKLLQTQEEIERFNKQYHENGSRKEDSYKDDQSKEVSSSAFAVNAHKDKKKQFKSDSHKKNKSSQAMKNCAFCGQNHFSDQCTEIESEEKRYEKAVQEKMCFICLKKGHPSKDCKSAGKKKCYHCKSLNHHTAICKKKRRDEKNKTNSYKKPIKNNTNAVIVEKSDDEEGYVVASVTATKIEPKNNEKSALVMATLHQNNNYFEDNDEQSDEETILMTKEVTLLNPKDKKCSIKTLAFLDQGSMLSFISTNVAHELNLQPIGEDTILMNTFGNKDSTKIKCFKYGQPDPSGSPGQPGPPAPAGSPGQPDQPATPESPGQKGLYGKTKALVPTGEPGIDKPPVETTSEIRKVCVKFSIRRREWAVPFPLWRQNGLYEAILMVTVFFDGDKAVEAIRQCSKVVPVTVAQNLCQGVIQILRKAICSLADQHIEKEDFHVFPLSRGKTEDWNGLKITLNSLDVEKPKILDKKFISDGKRTAVLTEETEKIAKLIKCKDLMEATTGDCKFELSECDCQPLPKVVNCICSEQDLEKVYAEHNLLPNVQNEDTYIMAEGRRVYSHPKSAVTEMQMTIKGLRIQSEVEMNTCKISNVKLEGCYGCNKGTRLHLVCTTDFGSSVGHVECTSQNFPIECQPEGKKNVISLYWNQANVNEKCQAICPSSTSEFKIEKMLKMVPTTEDERDSIIGPDTHKDLILPDLWFLTKFLFADMKNAFIFITYNIIIIFTFCIIFKCMRRGRPY